MNIWLVNHYALPPTQTGGTRHYALARELICSGHQVTLIASSFSHFSLQDTHLRKGERWRHELIDEVPFLWLHTPAYAGNSVARLWNMLMFSVRVWAGMGMRQLDPPDVVIGSVTHLFGALAAERLATRRGIPFVLEIRDLWPQTLIELGKLSPRHPMVQVMERIERHLYRRAARIVTVLPGAVEHMVAKGAGQSKIVWIPNGVDFSRVPPPKPPGDNGRCTLVYAGSHGIANGLDTLLDAAALLQRDGWADRAQFRFIGDGPQKPRLCQRARDEGIRNVSFDAAVPKADVYRVLQEADILLVTLKNLPLYRWGMSLNKLFDYLAAARPIVFGANVPANPVSEAQAGLTVAPEDARAMAGAIKHLMAMSPAERWQMGLNGRRFVEEHHDYRHLARRLEGVLAAVVHGAP